MEVIHSLLEEMLMVNNRLWAAFVFEVKLNNQIESIQEFVEFTTIDTLKSSIKHILDDKSDLNQQLNNAQIEIDKLNTEKRKMNLLINDLTKKNTLQISQIERLTQKLEEARSIVTEESASSHEMNLALRKEIDEKENEIEVLKYEIDRMRSIVSFAKPEDLFSSVSSLINSRNQEIEKLTFSISQKETKYNQKNIYLKKYIYHIILKLFIIQNGL